MDSVQSGVSRADCKNTMWCKQCQEDVPGLALSGDGGFVCPRCSGTLRTGRSADLIGERPEPATAPAAEPSEDVLAFLHDDWEMADQLRHIERVLGNGKRARQRRQAAARREAARLDAPHAGPPAWHVGTCPKPAPRKVAAGGERGWIMSAFTWAVLSLGTMAFVCGTVLLGWSLCTDRPELWAVGTPIALCGQIALLIGLVLQLDRLWHTSRHATARLESFNQQLRELKTATTLMGSANASPGSSFYAHMAGGAGPQLLLSDLKSQLDLLALKLGGDEGLGIGD
jgi:hypothetical protein